MTYPSLLRRSLLALLLIPMLGLACDDPVRTQAEDDPTEDTEEVESWPAEVNWVQVWGDEFDYEGRPNGAKWRFETGGDGWGNQELQYYTERRENARVNGDHLIIEARRESFQSNNYTSARLNSKQEWTYGRYEIRARLPEGRGTWPALWMLAEKNTYGDAYWPDNGEIDIMEHVGYDVGTVHATVHTEAYNHIKGTQRGSSTTVSNATSDFNVYAVEWTPDEIRAYVNGQQYFSFANERASDPGATYEEWPFDEPFFLLMNIAVGGTWGGAEGVDANAFPQTMAVDYVRVYQPDFVVE